MSKDLVRQPTTELSLFEVLSYYDAMDSSTDDSPVCNLHLHRSDFDTSASELENAQEVRNHFRVLSLRFCYKILSSATVVHIIGSLAQGQNRCQLF